MTRLICTFSLSILVMAVVQFGLTATAIRYPWAPLVAGVVSCICLYIVFERMEAKR